MKKRLFSEAEIEWLRREYPLHCRADTARLFALEFGWPVTINQLKVAKRHYGFGNAKVPDVKPNSGQFRKGQSGRHTLPVYSERWRQRSDGSQPILFIKIPEPSPWPCHKQTGWSQKSHWVRKAVWVWEQEHGPVPEGHAILQLDGDPANCAPENLECVPKRVLQLLNHRSAPKFAGHGSNPVRVRIAQVRALIAERRKEMTAGTTGQ